MKIASEQFLNSNELSENLRVRSQAQQDSQGGSFRNS